MRQEFHINKGSVNPVLRMELINDGRYDYLKSDIMGKALQDADVMFSMEDINTGVLKISKAKCEVLLAERTGCEEIYVIEYQWKERDTKDEGIYKGYFTIDFHGNVKEEGLSFPKGKLIMPISEDLIIYVK